MGAQLRLFEERELPRISFTQLSVFLRCPLEFKLRFVDRREGEFAPMGIEVSLGRVLHKLAQEYLKLPAGQRTQAFLQSRCKDLVSKLTSRTSLRGCYPVEQALAHFDSNFSGLEIGDLEMAFEEPFSSHILTGRIDCIVNGPRGSELIEFKVRDYYEFEYERQIDRYLQLLFYFLGIRRTGRDVPRGAYYFFDSGIRDEIEFSEEVIREGEHRIKQLLERMSNETGFAPRHNQLCPTCGYKRLCPIGQESLRGG